MLVSYLSEKIAASEAEKARRRRIGEVVGGLGAGLAGTAVPFGLLHRYSKSRLPFNKMLSRVGRSAAVIPLAVGVGAEVGRRAAGEAPKGQEGILERRRAAGERASAAAMAGVTLAGGPTYMRRMVKEQLKLRGGKPFLKVLAPSIAIGVGSSELARYLAEKHEDRREKRGALLLKSAAKGGGAVKAIVRHGGHDPVLRGPFHKKVWQLLKAHAPKATAYAMVGAGIIGGAIGYHKVKKRIQHQEGYKRMLEVHPSLKKEDPNLVVTRYNSLFNLAPTLARDPLVSGSIVKQWIEYPVVSATTLKDVAKAEADLRPTRLMLPELLGAGHVLAGG